MILNEEQRLLQQSIAEFLKDQCPVEEIRTLRDHPTDTGYRQELWQAMVALGVPAVSLPETYGGLGFGYLGLGAIMQDMGRHLAASPLFSTVVLAANIIEHCASDTQKIDWLSSIASGDETYAVAIDEGRHFAPLQTSLSAANGVINGRKVFVLDASGANYLLVLVRVDGEAGTREGLKWVRLSTNHPGIRLQRRPLMDGRNACDVLFDHCEIPNDAWLEGDLAWRNSELALDKSTIVLAAEMLGGARELLERTVTYLSDREQFDVKIGTFQALQHRCAQMLCQLEMAQSSVQKGLASIDYGLTNLRSLASQIKYLTNECYLHISNEAVQMHGGMGVTDEVEIGLFLKRARVCVQILGDSSFHKDAFARSQGF
ncbi:MAG TPA: acyl-CoA dehydrogenase family protein [Pseudomonadales bacterium]|nr:acyl-CoA dehydrogenase family protein [Pseudomonadales bacterium]